MRPHDVHQEVLTREDVDSDTEEAFLAAVTDRTDVGDADFLEREDGTLELRLDHRIGEREREQIREIATEHLPVELSEHERIYLDQTVAWPKPKYEICVGFK